VLESAFIAMSLDSALFTREWFRFAFPHLLETHKDLTVVFGNRLFMYNKTVVGDEGKELRIDLPLARAREGKRATEIHVFLEGEVARLPPGLRERVTLARWEDFTDTVFQDIYRVLSIAYAGLQSFRDCVDLDVETHLMGRGSGLLPQNVHRRLSALYVVEETALLIRIAENGRPFDFYPQNQIHTLEAVYTGDFANAGLSVEGLVGHPQRRIFTPLPLPQGVLAKGD